MVLVGLSTLADGAVVTVASWCTRDLTDVAKGGARSYRIRRAQWRPERGLRFGQPSVRHPN